MKANWGWGREKKRGRDLSCKPQTQIKPGLRSVYKDNIPD